jgi:hypothetical protein
MTLLDYILVTSIGLCGAAAAVLFFWAFARQGRRRFNAERR